MSEMYHSATVDIVLAIGTNERVCFLPHFSAETSPQQQQQTPEATTATTTGS